MREYERPSLANIGNVDDPSGLSRGGGWIFLSNRPFSLRNEFLFNIDPRTMFHNTWRKAYQDCVYAVTQHETNYKFSRGHKITV